MTAADPGAARRETRNWMFVLDERCAQCGFDARTVPLDEISHRLRRTLPGWAAALAAPSAVSRPAPEVWSPVEYACHVRDLARLLPARLALVVAFDEPPLANWDQDQAAVDGRYWAADPASTARELDRWTCAAAAAVDAVHGEQWHRRGHRSDGSTLSAEDMTRLLVHETEHHLIDAGGRIEAGADHAAVADIVRRFFAAFVSGAGAAESVESLRDVLVPEALVVRTCGEPPVLYDVDGFLAPRAELLAAAGLVGFREWVTDLRIEIFGDIASVWCDYAKEWTSDGVLGSGRGRKAIHLVRTSGGWRISAAAWDDERPGVPMVAPQPRS